MNNSKCNKCSLVNPVQDVVCRRCGGMLGMPVYQSVTEEKTNLPKLLFMVPFLLIALGLGYWYIQTGKKAIDSTQVVQEAQGDLTTDKKVTAEDPAVVARPRDFYDQLPPERREAAREALKRDWTPAPIYTPSQAMMDENARMKEQHQKNMDLRDRLLPPGAFHSGP